MKKVVALFCSLVLSTAVSAGFTNDDGGLDLALDKLSDWPRWGQNFTNNHTNLFANLKTEDAAKFKEACRIDHVRIPNNANDSLESTSAQPIIVNDVVYWSGMSGHIGATKIDRDNNDKIVGCHDLWVKDVNSLLGFNLDLSTLFTAPAVRVSPAYYVTKNGKPAVFYTGVANALTLFPIVPLAYSTPVFGFSLDAKTGNPLFIVPIGQGANLDPDTAWPNATSSPVVYNGVAYFGLASFNNAVNAPAFGGFPLTFRGQVIALDLNGNASSGYQPYIKWRQYMLPKKPKKWQGPWFTGAGVWTSGMSLLPLAGKNNKGLLYLGTGQLYSYPQFTEDCLTKDLPVPLVFGDFTATKVGHVGSGLQTCYDQSVQKLKDMRINEPLANNSIVALNIEDGSFSWVHPTNGIDTWQGFCGSLSDGGGFPLPNPSCTLPTPGPDWDVGGSAPIVATLGLKPIIISHNKGGMVFVLDGLNGSEKLKEDVCVGSSVGGIHWGLSYDPVRKLILAQCSGGHFKDGIVGVDDIAYSSVLADGSVVCQRGYLNAIDVQTGDLKWQAVAAPSESSPLTCPTGDFAPDKRFKYEVSFDKVLKNKVDASVPVHVMPRSSSIPNQNAGKARMHSPVTIAGDLIFMPVYDGVAYIINANNGTYLNELHCDKGALYQGIAVTNDTVGFGCGYRFLGDPTDAGDNFMLFGK